MTSLSDRRKSPRIAAELPIAVEGGPLEATGKTLNISENGVYFEVPHFIEPLTKVRMELFFPDEGGAEEDGTRVGFDGVVVRVEPEEPTDHPGAYKVAVFFTHVPESSMTILMAFIERNMTD
ncbi:MAG: PilZ domain-containing protein [Candidatus Krumholzibacteria bacterium]|nr:PilZ domain-containing protein [Candidatus Krumholzibacteria bacterium]